MAVTASAGPLHFLIFFWIGDILCYVPVILKMEILYLDIFALILAIVYTWWEVILVFICKDNQRTLLQWTFFSCEKLYFPI